MWQLSKFVQNYPVTKEYVSPDSAIQHLLIFERGIVKIKNNELNSLIHEEL